CLVSEYRAGRGWYGRGAGAGAACGAKASTKTTASPAAARVVKLIVSPPERKRRPLPVCRFAAGASSASAGAAQWTGRTHHEDQTMSTVNRREFAASAAALVCASRLPAADSRTPVVDTH